MYLSVEQTLAFDLGVGNMDCCANMKRENVKTQLFS